MIQFNHEQHHIGYFDTPQAAARAYDVRAIKQWGALATTNFPVTDYTTASSCPPGPSGVPLQLNTDAEEVRKAGQALPLLLLWHALSGGPWLCVVYQAVKVLRGLFGVP